MLSGMFGLLSVDCAKVGEIVPATASVTAPGATRLRETWVENCCKSSEESMSALALLWQIYSRCFSLQIHFLQRGHRCGGGRAMSSRMAWRTAGNVGRGGGPLILFFPPCCFKPAILEESVGDHRHERMTVKALPGSALEVIETKFFFQLLVSLLANPSCLDGGR